MKTKAYAYLRVSGAGQVDGDGYKRQEEAINRYCQANGIEVIAWYKEQETGTIQDRPQLAKLMVELEHNARGIKTVLIERLDRLARDLMVQEVIIQDFKEQGIQLISTTEGEDLCSNDATRELIRQILGAVAQYDKTMLVLKLKAARDREKVKTGKCEGRKAYGETEEEKKVLSRIRAMRRTKRGGHKGMTLQAIANRLNQEGIATKSGKHWSPAHVYNVLK